MKNGIESKKDQGLYPAQNTWRFDRKLPLNISLYIQFTVSF